MSELMIETGVEPPLSGKYSRITKAIIKAEMEQWIKISGFKDLNELKSAQRTLRSGKRSISVALAKQGIVLETRVLLEETVLYVRKAPGLGHFNDSASKN